MPNSGAKPPTKFHALYRPVPMSTITLASAKFEKRRVASRATARFGASSLRLHSRSRKAKEQDRQARHRWRADASRRRTPAMQTQHRRRPRRDRRRPSPANRQPLSVKPSASRFAGSFAVGFRLTRTAMTISSAIRANQTLPYCVSVKRSNIDRKSVDKEPPTLAACSHKPSSKVTQQDRNAPTVIP